MGNLTEKFVLMPEHLVKCVDTVAFIQEVLNRVSPTCNIGNAYYQLEQEYEQHFGKKKFSDFTSFRVLMYRHNKKKRNP